MVSAPATSSAWVPRRLNLASRPVTGSGIPHMSRIDGFTVTVIRSISSAYTPLVSSDLVASRPAWVQWQAAWCLNRAWVVAQPSPHWSMRSRSSRPLPAA